jgi:hypothetical protein
MINYSIVVLSCDKYSSLWPSFFARLSKYWTDTPAATYLVTNHLEPDLPNVTILAIGEDVDWSSNLLNALSRIDTDYIYILLEDVYVNKIVDKAYLDDVFKCITELSPNYVNTKALPVPRGLKFGTRIREVVKGSHYRASLCNAFWKKDMLLELIIPGETPWEFERRGSERSNTHGGFYGTTRNMLEFDHIIIGGKVARDVVAIEDVVNSEILKDFTILSRFRWISFRATILRNKLFSACIPQTWQQTIRRYLE